MNDSSGKKSRVINRLKYYREKLNVDQKEMEWRIGIAPRTWTDYETGVTEPKIKKAQKFADVFNDIAAEKGIDIERITTDHLYPPKTS